MQTTEKKWPEGSSLFVYHLIMVYRHLHQALNAQLVASGFVNIQMDAVKVIPYIGKTGTRLSELQTRHSIPKATLSRLVNRLYGQGFIDKMVDPSDSRANRLTITDKGAHLIQTATRLADEQIQALVAEVHPLLVSEFTRGVHRLYRHVIGEPLTVGEHLDDEQKRYQGGQVIIELDSVCADMNRVITADLANQATPGCIPGHGSLMSHQVNILAHISQGYERAIDIAGLESVSKQSISDVTHALRQRGLITHRVCERDRRTQRLLLTSQGQAVIAQLIDCYQHLDQDCSLAFTDSAGLSWQSFMALCRYFYEHFVRGAVSADTRRLVESVQEAQLDDVAQYRLRAWLVDLASTLQRSDPKAFAMLFDYSEESCRLSASALKSLQNMRLTD